MEGRNILKHLQCRMLPANSFSEKLDQFAHSEVDSLIVGSHVSPTFGDSPMLPLWVPTVTSMIICSHHLRICFLSEGVTELESDIPNPFQKSVSSPSKHRCGCLKAQGMLHTHHGPQCPSHEVCLRAGTCPAHLSFVKVDRAGAISRDN